MTMGKQQVTDPRLATKFSEFYLAGKETITVSFPKQCFSESLNGITYCVKSVINDYMYDLNKAAIKCKLSRDQIIKYQYNPRVLCSDIYGSGDLYYVILLLNGICDVKEFNLSTGYVYMLKKADMKSYMTAIYKQESADLKAYNSIHVT